MTAAENEQPEQRNESSDPVPTPRRYATPKLIEYGRLSSLTKGNSGANGETAGGMMIK